MEKIAFIFPGQGAQAPGMGKAMHDAYPAAAAVFDIATEGLGRDVRKICWETDAATLSDTANAQPGILAASVACLQPLLAAGVRPDAVAGLSLGEYTALVAAESLDLAIGMALVDIRARLMQQAVPKGEGAMAAIIGLDRPAVLAACAAGAAHGVVEPANFNAPDQVVISGQAGAVEAASAAARSAGAKRVMPLAVSAPFHCSLLNVVCGEFGKALDAADFRTPRVPVIANTSARQVHTADEVRAALLSQVASAVLWEDSVRHMHEDLGIQTFIEIGPGKVLSRFVGRTCPGARTLSVEDPASLAATLHLLQG